jgi:hypothetical protein
MQSWGKGTLTCIAGIKNHTSSATYVCSKCPTLPPYLSDCVMHVCQSCKLVVGWSSSMCNCDNKTKPTTMGLNCSSSNVRNRGCLLSSTQHYDWESSRNVTETQGTDTISLTSQQQIYIICPKWNRYCFNGHLGTQEVEYIIVWTVVSFLWFLNLTHLCTQERSRSLGELGEAKGRAEADIKILQVRVNWKQLQFPALAQCLPTNAASRYSPIQGRKEGLELMRVGWAVGTSWGHGEGKCKPQVWSTCSQQGTWD